MRAAAVLEVLRARGGVVTIDGDALRVRRCTGLLTPALKQLIAAEKVAILALLKAERAAREAPPPTRTDAAPCEACGSPTRWTWIDGREICRECLIQDRTPLIGPSRHHCRGCSACDTEVTPRGPIRYARCGLARVTGAP